MNLTSGSLLNTLNTTFHQAANSSAIQHLDCARDQTIDFLKQNFNLAQNPDILPDFAGLFKNATLGTFLEAYEPGFLAAASLGAIGGCAIAKRPILGVAALTAGWLLTSNKTDLAYLAIIAVTSAAATKIGSLITNRA